MTFFKILFSVIFTSISFITFSQQKAGKIDTAQHIKLYTCPIHDSIAMKKPGYCPICGMKLQLTSKEQMKKDITKTYSCPIHTEVTSYIPGKCPKCGMSLSLSSKEKMKIEVINNYTCPMHSNVKSGKPGKCPYCGMDLQALKNDK